MRVACGAVSLVDPDSTGLNPSWRKALLEVYVRASWPEGSTADFIFQQIHLPVLILMTQYGTGVDNILQFTIVLADRSLITTNSFQYPDLRV